MHSCVCATIWELELSCICVYMHVFMCAHTHLCISVGMRVRACARACVADGSVMCALSCTHSSTELQALLEVRRLDFPELKCHMN